MEDNRFKDAPSIAKRDIPHQLHWFLKEDTFTDELVGFSSAEIQHLKNVTEEAYGIFVKATQRILERNELKKIGIPSFFEPCVYHSWENRSRHPFCLGRFDLSGGVDQLTTKVIEFNADTASTLPETLYWQTLQLSQAKESLQQFNNLRQDLTLKLQSLAGSFDFGQPTFLGSSLGYKEDVLNVNAILDVAHQAGFDTHYLDLEKVVFSDNGIFYEVGDEYVPVDVWYKLFPWDWVFKEEPELAKILNKIIINDQAVILNPAYTTIWQNKVFMSYITEHFPNNVIAETRTELTWEMSSYVKKPMYGRIGENITLKDGSREVSTAGDYGRQPMIYQKYYPLGKDSESYYYQPGVFYSDRPSALNVRAQNHPILTDDCEFMSHFIY